MAVGGRRWPSVAVGGRRWPSVAVGEFYRLVELGLNGKTRKNSQNLQNRVLLRNSKEIMLFSILSGIYDRLLGFTCVLHRFYYWLYVSLM